MWLLVPPLQLAWKDFVVIRWTYSTHCDIKAKISLTNLVYMIKVEGFFDISNSSTIKFFAHFTLKETCRVYKNQSQYLDLSISCIKSHIPWITGSGFRTRSKNFKMPLFPRYQKFLSWGKSNGSKTTPKFFSKFFFNKYGR